MDYRTLGRTGVRVSPLCLGAMMFGAWGNPDHDDSIRIIHAALDAGINFVDTADVYSRGESEEIVGKALRRTAATTSCWPPRCTASWAVIPTTRATRGAGSSQECENSLRRLGTDWIDLYQIHRPEPDDRHRRDPRCADRPRAPGQGPLHRRARPSRPPTSSRPSGWPSGAGRERFVCEQPPYSLLVRGIEADVLPVTERYGMGVIAWSPLAGGWLSGQYRTDAEIPTSLRAQRIPGRYDMSAARPTSASWRWPSSWRSWPRSPR